MDLYAFELAPPYTVDELNGATVAYGPATHVFDVKQALVEGNGTIVTDDPLLIATLRGFPDLQEGTVPNGATPVVLPGADQAQAPQPTLYVPQEPLNLGDQVPAVHGEEPATVEQAAEQPASQIVTDEPPPQESADSETSTTDKPPGTFSGRSQGATS